MMRAMICAIAIIGAAAGATSARLVPYKTGSSGPSFFDLMPSSCAALAMGHTTVMATDPGSEWINPAGQAMTDYGEGFTLYGTPFGLAYPELDDKSTYRHYSLNYRKKLSSLRKRPLYVNATIAHTRYTSREYPEITYDGTISGIYRLKIRSYQASAALAADLGLQMAAGGTIRNISEDAADLEVSGWGFDFGALLRFPIGRWLAGDDATFRLRPALAIAWNDIGMSFENPTFGEIDAPTNRSLGVGLEFAALDRTKPVEWRKIGIKINYTGTKLLDIGDSTRYGVGAEICLSEALYLRAGQAYLGPYEPTTFGVELDSDGIRMIIASLAGPGTSDRLVERLSDRHLRLSIAYSTHIGSDTIFDDGDLLGVTVRY